MSYLHTIKIALLVFPFIAFLCLYPFILLQYHKYGSINPLRFLILLSFLLYIITIYFLVILPLPNINTVTYNPNMIKLLPFNFLISIIEEAHFSLTDFSTYVTIFTEPCIYTVLFNILMTIPFGMYLKYYFNCSFSKSIFLTFFLSLFFELTQLTGLYFIYPYPYRIFDVDDLLMNTLGGVIGYSLMSYISPYLPSRVDIDKASYKEGHTVSGLRRIILFISDVFLFLLFSLFLSLILPL